MATTRSDMPASERGRDLMDWLQVNSRLLGIAGAVVIVAVAGYWFYSRSRQIRMVNAERSLSLAQQSLGSGNTNLALSDLQKVAERYQGTSAGTEAALLLAGQHYEQGKFQDGINQLEKTLPKAGGSQATVQNLIGDGYAQMGKLADAAKAYERASEMSPYDSEKAYYKAKAARSYSSGGNVAAAKKLWTELAANDKSPSVAAEAKVRLAELSAQPAGKS
jgi:predicted negative regulator of RcsB-dependent stress response